MQHSVYFAGATVAVYREGASTISQGRGLVYTNRGRTQPSVQGGDHLLPTIAAMIRQRTSSSRRGSSG